MDKILYFEVEEKHKQIENYENKVAWLCGTSEVHIPNGKYRVELDNEDNFLINGEMVFHVRGDNCIETDGDRKVTSGEMTRIEADEWVASAKQSRKLATFKKISNVMANMYGGLKVKEVKNANENEIRAYNEYTTLK